MATSKTSEILDSVKEALSQLAVINERVNATHNLAVKTNGRVTTLEKKIVGDEAVAAYKKDRRNRDIVLFTAVCTLVGGLWWLTFFFQKG